MKRIFKYIAGVAAVAAMTSCIAKLNETPVFDPADSFVSFDKAAISVSEDGGKVSIPLTMASIDPEKINVSYEVVPGTAKAGENYSLVDASAVVAFDGQQRNAVIEINIVNIPGVFTGDLTFTVNLLSAGSLNLGANKSCTVKIADLDHPLAEILGAYTLTGESGFGGELQYDLVFDKDPSSITTVLISNLVPDLDPVYGNVISDEEGNFVKVSIPFSQVGAWNSSYTTLLAGFKAGGFYASEGTLELVRTETGWENADAEWGFGALAVSKSSGAIAGWIEGVLPDFTITKK